MERTVKTLLVDNQVLLRRSLVNILSRTASIKVLGEVSQGLKAISICRSVKPDVVLVDIELPGPIDGIEMTRRIKSDPSLKDIKVCILSEHKDETRILRALRAGATGYIFKDHAPEDVISAIHSVYSGHALLPPAYLESILPPPGMRLSKEFNVQRLTARQTEILRLVASGLSNTEIEVYLKISHSTLKSHINALLAKLDLRDRAQLVIAAYESQLVFSKS